MVDFLRAVAIVIAIVASIRARSAIGCACACALAYIVAADLASLVASSDRAPPGVHAGFAAVFLGPSGFPGRAQGVLPMSGVIGAHPFVIRVLTAIAAAYTFAVAHRRSSRLRPESEEARRVDAMARPFLGVALLDAAQIVMALLARVFLEPERGSQSDACLHESQRYDESMTAAKIAITIPVDTLDSAKKEVDAGRAKSLSAFVSEAVDEKLRRHELSEILDAMDAERGKPGKTARAWAKRVLAR